MKEYHDNTKITNTLKGLQIRISNLKFRKSVFKNSKFRIRFGGIWFFEFQKFENPFLEIRNFELVPLLIIIEKQLRSMVENFSPFSRKPKRKKMGKIIKKSLKGRTIFWSFIILFFPKMWKKDSGKKMKESKLISTFRNLKFRPYWIPKNWNSKCDLPR